MARVNIKAVRSSMNLSMQAFGEKLGVHWSTVSRWENGHTDPSPLALSRIRELQQPEAPRRRDYGPSEPDSDPFTQRSGGVVPASREE